ncbi:restriction endonuclease, partial [Enterobacter sp. CGMCC 5087]|uniref:antirestriction protein n=1 Tax=Enterobacter sp. CGMCC 5087 TaxID=2183878 RepID=UPI000D676939
MTDIINLNDTLPLQTQPAGTGSAPALTATLVPDNQRVEFWPEHFGSIPQWIILEPTVFAWMDRFCADYNGGIWNFYTLSNGGAFMAPDADDDSNEPWSLFNTLNGNGG